MSPRIARAIVVLSAAAILIAGAPAAFAQDAGYASHWGVSGSLVPRWEFPRPLMDIWNLDTDMKGTELRVGIVRGSDLGGDWGVSFVKKAIDDESVVQLRQRSCVQLPGGRSECARGAYHVTRDAGMTGVEAHLFMPFATIKRRVQIGATFAGGVARIDGTSDRFLEHLVVNGSTATRATDHLGEAPFKQTLQDLPQDWRVVPIGRAELGVGVLMRPGLKIRASGGINFPGYHRAGIHLQYLFGAR
jgi:hypothetical protein